MKNLLHKYMENGKLIGKYEEPKEIRNRTLSELKFIQDQ